MKIACIFIPHFPIHIELRNRIDIRKNPTVIVRTLGSSQTIVDFSPDIVLGKSENSLSHILSKYGDAHVIQTDDNLYRREWNSILDKLAQKSPLVEDAGFGMAYIGLHGIEPINRGGAQFIANIEKVIPSDFPAYIGIAENKFVSYIAALSSDNRGIFIAPSSPGEFLSKFPVDLLPVKPSIRANLHRFGLHKLGDVANIPSTVMEAQFSSDGRRIWSLANGNDPTVLINRNYEEVIEESITFSDPVNDIQSIIVGADLILDKAFLSPFLRGRSVRLIRLEAKIYRQSNWSMRCTFKDPIGASRLSRTRVHDLIWRANIPGPVESLGVFLSGLTKESSRQISFIPEVRKKEQISDAIRQLDTVLNEEAPIFYIREIEPWSRIPERRQMLTPVAR